MSTTTDTITKTVTRFWVVCDGTATTSAKTEGEARAKARKLASVGARVLRIERQVMTTETAIICEF